MKSCSAAPRAGPGPSLPCPPLSCPVLSSSTRGCVCFHQDPGCPVLGMPSRRTQSGEGPPCCVSRRRGGQRCTEQSLAQPRPRSHRDSPEPAADPAWTGFLRDSLPIASGCVWPRVILPHHSRPLDVTCASTQETRFQKTSSRTRSSSTRPAPRQPAQDQGASSELAALPTWHEPPTSSRSLQAARRGRRIRVRSALQRLQTPPRLHRGPTSILLTQEDEACE